MPTYELSDLEHWRSAPVTVELTPNDINYKTVKAVVLATDNETLKIDLFKGNGERINLTVLIEASGEDGMLYLIIGDGPQQTSEPVIIKLMKLEDEIPF